MRVEINVDKSKVNHGVDIEYQRAIGKLATYQEDSTLYAIVIIENDGYNSLIARYLSERGPDIVMGAQWRPNKQMYTFHS